MSLKRQYGRPAGAHMAMRVLASSGHTVGVSDFAHEAACFIGPPGVLAEEIEEYAIVVDVFRFAQHKQTGKEFDGDEVLVVSHEGVKGADTDRGAQWQHA